MKRVLLVEDDETLRQFLSSFLQSQGCRVFEACNGLVAINILKDQPVDLVITDIDMPEKNGIEFVTELRVTDQKTQVVVMSGRLEIPTEKFLGLEVREFIQKPFFSLETFKKLAA